MSNFLTSFLCAKCYESVLNGLIVSQKVLEHFFHIWRDWEKGVENLDFGLLVKFIGFKSLCRSHFGQVVKNVRFVIPVYWVMSGSWPRPTLYLFEGCCDGKSVTAAWTDWTTMLMGVVLVLIRFKPACHSPIITGQFVKTMSLRGEYGEGHSVTPEQRSWPLNRCTLFTQNQLSVRIPRRKMAKNWPSLIWQINILTPMYCIIKAMRQKAEDDDPPYGVHNTIMLLCLTCNTVHHASWVSLAYISNGSTLV